MMLFALFKWMLVVKGLKIKLKFTDERVIEYAMSDKMIKASNFISASISFNKKETGKENAPISMRCNSKTFIMIERLVKKENKSSWEELAREFAEPKALLMCLWAIDYLCYKEETRGEMYERMVEHILPRIVLWETEKKAIVELIDYGEYIFIEKTRVCAPIVEACLRRYGLGIRMDDEIAIVCKDRENIYRKEITENFKFRVMRVLPEALDTGVEKEAAERLGVIIWLFSEVLEIPRLNISGCIITEGHIRQLSSMENLEGLNLEECTLKVDRRHCGIIEGFKVLKDLNVSGMILENVFAGILCTTTSLKRLKMEKCFIKPEISFEFIGKQNKLEELRIGNNRLSEKQLNILFNHGSIKVLDMELCTVEDMYVFGGSIESVEVLKIFNGGGIYVGENEIKIIISNETESNECNARWLMKYNGRIIWFSDESVMKVSLTGNDDDETEETHLRTLAGKKGNRKLENSYRKKKRKKYSKINIKLKCFNGCRVTFEDRCMVITPDGDNGILEKLRRYNGCTIDFNGKEDVKMNFIEETESYKFIRNVEELRCRQVYFEDAQIEMILSHRGIKKLGLKQCGLESEMIMKMRDSNNLEELDLSDNNMIGEDDLVHIIKECSKLRKLDMSKCRMLVKKEFLEVPMLKNLEELKIGGNKLNRECCEYIFKNIKLIKLNLEDCGLMDDSLNMIENLEGLKELYVGKNYINKNDLNRIFTLKNLEVLSMARNRLFTEEYEGNNNIDGIKELSELKVLDMSECYLRNVNVEEIFELKKLKELRIENSKLLWGQLVNISKLGNLEKLNIKGNKVDRTDINAVSELRMLKELRMASFEVAGEGVFENIRGLKDSLLVLDICGCFLFIERELGVIGELINLQELRLAEYEYTRVPTGVLTGILGQLRKLRVLRLGDINAGDILDCDLEALSMLEVLKIKCTGMKAAVIERLGKLVNIKELELTCTKGTGNIEGVETIELDILAFPRSLRKLKVEGDWTTMLDLKKNSEGYLANLEELCLYNIKEMTECNMKNITSCSKLRKLNIEMCYGRPGECKVKGIERMGSLEVISLKGMDLSMNGVEIMKLKNIRQLTLYDCNINEDCINEMGKFKCLESLVIRSSEVKASMNGILRLKNLRCFCTENIRFDYDEEGAFGEIKGFDILECYNWSIYKNNECVESNETAMEIRKEAKLNNWKGLTKFNSWYHDINSVLFLGISSQLVFTEEIIIEPRRKLEISGEIGILENCHQLQKIKCVNHKSSAYVPTVIAIRALKSKLMLRKIEMHVESLTKELGTALVECKHLHDIILSAEMYEEGFFAVLFNECGRSFLRTVEVYIGGMSWCYSVRVYGAAAENANNEAIIKYIGREDTDAIMKAREEGVFVEIRFCFDLLWLRRV